MDLYIHLNEQQTGPFTDADAIALASAGEISRGCLAWREGMPQWLPLEEIVALPPAPPNPIRPAELPPVAARISEPTGIKGWAEGLEKRLAATRFGPLVDRHGGWIGRVVWGIMLIVFIVKCRHGR